MKVLNSSSVVLKGRKNKKRTKQLGRTERFVFASFRVLLVACLGGGKGGEVNIKINLGLVSPDSSKVSFCMCTYTVDECVKAVKETGSY